MKSVQLEITPVREEISTDVSSAPASAKPVTYATVYTFVIYDHDKRATAIYPRMATLETIARMRGKVNEDTAWVVDASTLDVEGFYPVNPPRA